jgi:hypothetical protein
MFRTIRRLAVAVSIATLALSTLAMSPAHAAAPVPLQTPPHPLCRSLCITQVSTEGPSGPLDEFVELGNPGLFSADIGGTTVWACPGSGPMILLGTIPSGTILHGSLPDPAVETGQFLLLANADYSGVVSPDGSFTRDIPRLGGVMLRRTPTRANPSGIIDAVGFSARNTCVETMPARPQPPGASSARDDGDTNNNRGDFVSISPPFPRNSHFCGCDGLVWTPSGRSELAPPAPPMTARDGPNHARSKPW